MICLGTRLVVLITPNDSNDGPTNRTLPVEGLLVVYEQLPGPLNGDSKWPLLRIEVGTNNVVYRGEIDVSQVRLPEDQKSEVSKYLLYDAREHPDISVLFEHSSKDQSLELVIQQRLSTAKLKKFIYAGTLLPSFKKKDLKDATGDDKSSILQFCHTLGNAVNESRMQIKSLQQNVQSKQQSMDHWKDTALHLDKQVWQKEKDQLVHNFLKLWNERQARAKKQFKELQEELELTKAALAAKTNEKKRGRALKVDETKAGEDDLAAPSEPIPLDQVAALAAAQKIPATTKAHAILEKGDTVSVATLMQQAEEYEKRKRLPPVPSNEDSIGSTNGERPPTKKGRKEKEAPSAPPAKSGKQKNNGKPIKNPPLPSPSSSPNICRDSPDSVEDALRAQIRAGIQKDLSFSDDEEKKDKQKLDVPDWDLSF